MLVEAGQRLRRAVRPGDTVVRLGGDEFVVVCPGLTLRAEAEALSVRLEGLLSAPLSHAGHRLAVGASVGGAVAPHDDPVALLAAADRAMYARKAARKAVRGRGPAGDPAARPVAGRLRDAALSPAAVLGHGGGPR